MRKQEVEQESKREKELRVVYLRVVKRNYEKMVYQKQLVRLPNLTFTFAPAGPCKPLHHRRDSRTLH